MSLIELEVEDLRCLQKVELDLHPRVNLILGPNGSGKTSLLEALYLLGRGRSFRTRHTERLIRHGARRLRAIARTNEAIPSTIGFGFDRESGAEARIDRRAVRSFTELAEAVPVQAVDPGIHRLVEEGPGHRRRWLDWGVFHVEPGFVGHWLDFSRVLKQRNAALRQRADPTPWDAEFARLGEGLAESRVRALQALAPHWQHIVAALLGREVTLSYFRGWSQDQTLSESLVIHRASDRERGRTTSGPHRFDVLLRWESHAAREVLSRGQQKLLGAALALAMARLVGSGERRPPLLLLDDPAAELDLSLAENLVRETSSLGGQLILTALHAGDSPFGAPDRVFHVEQGRVHQL
jgi:DNA replication and repair protein RecF